MRKVTAVIVFLILCLILIPVISVSAQDGWLPEPAVDIGTGDTYTVNYTASNCVDLQIELRDPDGSPDDTLDILLNSCNITTLYPYSGSVNATVSLGPGQYQIDFVYVSGGPPHTLMQYRLTEYAYTGTHTYECLPDVGCPVVEAPKDTDTKGATVGIDIYPVDKTTLLMPWIALVAVMIFGGAFLIYRRAQNK